MDYEHGYHAGNHADVFKHTAWLAVLAAAKRARKTVLETHGGSGGYALGPTGEWTAGVGRLLCTWGPGVATGSAAVDRYLGRLRRVEPEVPRRYPGSPRLGLDAIGPNDRLVACEAQEEPAKRLRALLAGEPRARVVHGDGWAALAEPPPGEALVALIDPPFTDKEDWAAAVTGLAALRRARPDATALLWYPVKRVTRPNQLHAALSAAGVPFVAAELVVTPLEVERRALGGSGVLGVGLPTSVWVEILGAAPVLGPALATHEGRWTLRTTSA